MDIENRESQLTMTLRVDLGTGADVNGVGIYVIPADGCAQIDMVATPKWKNAHDSVYAPCE